MRSKKRKAKTEEKMRHATATLRAEVAHAGDEETQRYSFGACGSGGPARADANRKPAPRPVSDLTRPRAAISSTGRPSATSRLWMPAFPHCDAATSPWRSFGHGESSFNSQSMNSAHAVWRLAVPPIHDPADTCPGCASNGSRIKQKQRTVPPVIPSCSSPESGPVSGDWQRWQLRSALRPPGASLR